MGENKALSLQLLTLDLSKLDIRARSFTSTGVTFKAQHLSKQSRSSKPLADFFYPRYPEDKTICPVVTLQAYEDRTSEFRALSTDNQKTSIFLSWIGKHDPVTSSTIARWLKTCLSEAGIDTEILKAHSVRGASSSKAATAGVTTADILQAADWSSESTFQKYYHHPILGQKTNLSLGGQSCHLLRCQTYMLIWKRSLLKCNFRMAQGTQCLDAIRNYTRKVKLKYQHSHPSLPTGGFS